MPMIPKVNRTKRTLGGIRPAKKVILKSSHNANSATRLGGLTSTPSPSNSGSEYPDFHSATSSPLVAVLQCREAYSRDYNGHNAKTYEALTAGMAAGIALDTSSKAWAEFVRAANDQKLYSRKIKRDKDQANCISIAVEIIFHPSHGYKDAKRKGRAMEYLYLTKHSPYSALQTLKERGLASVVTEAQKKLPLRGLSAEQKAQLKHDLKSGKDTFFDDLVDDDEDDVRATSVTGTSGGDADDRIEVSLARNLIIHASKDLMPTALRTNVGETFSLVVENKGISEGGYITLELVKIG